ncbi:MAG: radical SAM protein, partial [Planctomycetota bacterium]
MRLEKVGGSGLGAAGAVGAGSGSIRGSMDPARSPLRIALHRSSSRSSGAPLPPLDLLCAATSLRDHLRARQAALPRLSLTDAALEPDPAPQLEAAAAFAPDALVLSADPVELERRSRDAALWLDPLREAGHRLDSVTSGTTGQAATRIAWIEEDGQAAEALLTSGAADLVVRGEADATLPEILERAVEQRRSGAAATWSGTRGVSWLQGGEVRHERELGSPTSIPTPAWDLIDLSRYSTTGPLEPSGRGASRDALARAFSRHLPDWVRRMPRSAIGQGVRRGIGQVLGGPPERRATIYTVRACSPDCPTCHGSFGMHGHQRPVKEILQEVRELVHKHRIRELAIGDHAFDGQPGRALAIAEGIAKIRSAPGAGHVRLTFPRGLRGDGLTPELIDALHAAGLRTAPLRVVTASPRLQRLLKENINLERVSRALDYLAAHGGRGHLMLRLGLPTETVGEVAHTIRWARSSSAVSASFESGRHIDLGPAWTQTQEGEIDDFPSLRRRALTLFYSSPK